MRTHLHWPAGLLLCLALAGCKDAATETAAGEAPALPVMRWLALAPKPKPVVHPPIRVMAAMAQAKETPDAELPLDLEPVADIPDQPANPIEPPLQQLTQGDLIGPPPAVVLGAAEMVEAPASPTPMPEPAKPSELSVGGAFGDALLRGAWTLGFDFDEGSGSRSDLTLRDWLSGERYRSHGGSRKAWFSVAQSLPDDPLPSPGAAGGVTRLALGTGIDRVGEFVVGMGFGLADRFGLVADMQIRQDQPLRPGAVTAPFLALAGNGLTASYGRDVGSGWKLRFGYATTALGEGFGTPEKGNRRTAVAAEVSRATQGGATWGLIAGYLSEQGSLLGASGAGIATFQDQYSSDFLTAFGTVPLSQNARLFGSATMGWSEGAAMGQGGAVSGVRSQGYSLGVSFDDLLEDQDRFSLTVSQPLKAVSGSAKVGGKAFSLVPSGSEIDIEAAYRLKLSPNEEVRLNVLTGLQPGHDSSAGPEVTVGAKYRLTW